MALIATTATGHIRFANRRARTLLCREGTELIERAFDDLLATASRPERAAQWVQCLTQAPPFDDVQLCSVHPGGTEIELVVSLERVEIEGEILILAALRPAGLARLREPGKEVESLAARLARLESLIQSVPLAIYECSAKGNLAPTFVSEGMRDQLGHAPEDVVSTPGFWFAHLCPDDVACVEQAVKDIFAHGSVQYEYRFRHKDGEYRWGQDRARLIRDHNGVPERLVGCWFDVTESKLAEEALKASEAHIRELNHSLGERNFELEAMNHELEAFTYSVSHDLRAPLRAIDGFSHVLWQDHGHYLDSRGLDLLQRVHTAAQRMGQIIDDLLSLSRVTRSPLRLEQVDLSALAAEVAEGLRVAHPEHHVELVIEPGVAAVGDRRLLRILLENILDNAWKYTSRTQVPRVELGVERQAPEPVYFVRDNGAGFDMKYADRLFQAFQRLHGPQEFPGTGIGLATAARIVQRHGGRIWATGEVGQGATLWFTLPRTD